MSNATQAATPVTFQLEGSPKVYTLTFDFNAVCDAEEVSKCNLMGALAGGGISANQTRGLLLALLRPTEPQCVLADAGWLLSQDLPTVLSALTQAIKAAREEEPDAVQVLLEALTLIAQRARDQGAEKLQAVQVILIQALQALRGEDVQASGQLATEAPSATETQPTA